MSRKIVAIVGSPNVGKSTIFNRMIGDRHAIVDDEAGITRDRLYASCSWQGKTFSLVDTGGVEMANAPFQQQIRMQAEIAIDEADGIGMGVVAGFDAVGQAFRNPGVHGGELFIYESVALRVALFCRKLVRIYPGSIVAFYPGFLAAHIPIFVYLTEGGLFQRQQDNVCTSSQISSGCAAAYAAGAGSQRAHSACHNQCNLLEVHSSVNFRSEIDGRIQREP